MAQRNGPGPPFGTKWLWFTVPFGKNYPDGYRTAFLQRLPLQLVAFIDVEDELFGAPGTPDRDEYETRVALELLPHSIREYRRHHHLTQAQLGERLGVQKSQISKLERNSSNVTLDTLRRVFKALNVEVKILLQPAGHRA